jgi:hypothetical protein
MAMTGQSQPHEQWDRVAAELRAHREAQREAWGDFDANQVTRYLAGLCTPQERAAVEVAMRSLPDVRELIEVLQAMEFPVPPGPIPRGLARIWARINRGTVRTCALVGLGVAATFLLGLLIGRTVYHKPDPPLGPPELLSAKLTPVPRTFRGAAGAKDFDVEIRSPRSGFATIVLLQPGLPPRCFPEPGQPDVRVEAFELRKYGPLDRPNTRTTVLVIVTATPAENVIREHVPAAGPAPDQTDALEESLEQALWAAGHRWAAVGRISVESM